MQVQNTKTAEHYTWGDGCDGWRLLNRTDLSVIQERIPSGLGEVLHFHNKSRQVFYVLEGHLEIEVLDQKVHLNTGDSLEIAPMQTHRVSNTSASDVHFLVISAPSTMNDRVNVG
jgi:mannose-6-phosphate isomerase-like protein (cupin superfamily)